MEEYNEECFKRKLEHIRKKYDIMSSGYDRQFQHIITLRGWCITLIVAYTGYCASTGYFASKDRFFTMLVFPILVLVGFFTLEGFFKLNSWKIRKYIKKIDEMFMNKDDKEFRDAVSKYEFHSLQSDKHGKELKYEICEYYQATKNDRHAII